MTKRLLACVLTLAVAASAAACSGTTELDGGIRMPASASSLEGEHFEEVVKTLREAGFTNVETEALGDLITGWLNGEGEVKEVGVDGDTDFRADKEFTADAKIVVSYHSFPPEEEVELESAPSADSDEEVVAEQVLTAENNADLASLLAVTDYCSDVVVDFAAKYEGAFIAFDGNIGAMNNHGDSSTRYDMLIGAGDFSETSQPGPSFQFRDVNATSDLHLTGADIPDTIGVGDNLIIKAKVGNYESASCLFLLDPISTEVK